ncbi:TrmH family RNA methyltransferase [Flavihumibacter petaseus]|nr:RNA methyltransferase [Flavihumibacter petaseus]
MITKNQVKYIQSLSQKKLRDSEKLFVAEGPKVVGELLAMSSLQCTAIYGTQEWFDTQQPLAVTESQVIEAGELERISFLTTPNQVLALFRQPVWNHPPGNWQLLLDGIQDPGNLGTIIRIADWFGVYSIICSRDTADCFAPKVVQSTMASIGRVAVEYADLREYIAANAGRNYYAATLDGIPLTGVNPRLPATLVIGNESKGIRPEVLEGIQHQVTIPRAGEAESLNAAVATGILLSHLTS